MSQGRLQSGASDTERETAESLRARNVRTALILLSIAAVFFAGIVVNRWLFGGQ